MSTMIGDNARRSNTQALQNFRQHIESMNAFLSTILHSIERLNQILREHPSALPQLRIAVFKLKDGAVAAITGGLPWSSPRWRELRITAMQLASSPMWTRDYLPVHAIRSARNSTVRQQGLADQEGFITSGIACMDLRTDFLYRMRSTFEILRVRFSQYPETMEEGDSHLKEMEDDVVDAFTLGACERLSQNGRYALDTSTGLVWRDMDASSPESDAPLEVEDLNADGAEILKK
ncbi:hypothetical protein BC939DRAFT_502091 [Gamsiella multidivaricata]|uniref:uncharacterized protein n=1 Tax=Gamsiella multidivaricata TaxID=101098 RepID=UPI0022200E1D|nr:uncharacterized protein BC939DRAFT_502091 [Gamsiella multidivaricata]KAG0363682.1 hypothetical protein BGZ54_008069 [Gamsiella multidivaricata]KAI7825641.1 hypothetical protein BC939DRAFT_502091 [Gamsiella multidivaricata]